MASCPHQCPSVPLSTAPQCLCLTLPTSLAAWPLAPAAATRRMTRMRSQRTPLQPRATRLTAATLASAVARRHPRAPLVHLVSRTTATPRVPLARRRTRLAPLARPRMRVQVPSRPARRRSPSPVWLRQCRLSTHLVRAKRRPPVPTTHSLVRDTPRRPVLGAIPTCTHRPLTNNTGVILAHLRRSRTQASVTKVAGLVGLNQVWLVGHGVLRRCSTVTSTRGGERRDVEMVSVLREKSQVVRQEDTRTLPGMDKGLLVVSRVAACFVSVCS
ncbi:hypothetical protein BD414DRAFT_494394 [Trametes punicea]|nr:hypothetical protein BD414DRAFT_494394 [Trametes punicea]